MEDSDEAMDLLAREDDRVLLTVRNEEELHSLTVWVYEQEGAADGAGGNVFVSREVPLAVEWLDFALDWRSVLNGVAVTLRMRLRCKIHRKGRPRGGEAPCYDLLNEVVVDRGPGGFLSMIEWDYERDRLITKVHAAVFGRR